MATPYSQGALYFVEIPVCILQKDGTLNSTPRGTEWFFRTTPQQPPRPSRAPAPNILPCTGDEQAKAGSCLCGRLSRHVSLICTLGLLFSCSPAVKVRHINTAEHHAEEQESVGTCCSYQVQCSMQATEKTS